MTTQRLSRSALASVVAVVMSSSAALAQLDQCRDVLDRAIGEYFSEESAERQFVETSHACSMTYSEFTNFMNAGGKISYGLFSVSGNYTEQQHEVQRSHNCGNQEMSEHRFTTEYTFQLAVARGGGDPVSAWLECMKRREGLQCIPAPDEQSIGGSKINFLIFWNGPSNNRVAYSSLFGAEVVGRIDGQSVPHGELWPNGLNVFDNEFVISLEVEEGESVVEYGMSVVVNDYAYRCSGRIPSPIRHDWHNFANVGTAGWYGYDWGPNYDASVEGSPAHERELLDLCTGGANVVRNNPDGLERGASICASGDCARTSSELCQSWGLTCDRVCDPNGRTFVGSYPFGFPADSGFAQDFRGDRRGNVCDMDQGQWSGEDHYDGAANPQWVVYCR